jgi:tRNA(fMet)-specific endonuclease VapC
VTGKYLADTNVFIKLLRKDAAVAAKLAPLQGVCMCVHVLGELYNGTYISKQVAKNISEVTDLLKDAILLGSDRETAAEYGRLKAELFARGTPLPENDMWIAATALRHNLTLITFDAHFDAIPQLIKDRW